MIFFNTSLGRSSRFFTLVELLVVISIISVLSSVGVSGMQAARTKAADSGLKETLSSARNQAGIYYSTAGSYGYQATTTGFSIGSSGVFSDPKIAEAITAAERLSGGQVTYASDDSFYTLSIPLKADPTKSWCVDSMGHAGIIDGTIDTTSCVAARTTIRSGSGGGGGNQPSSCAASGACAETVSGGTCISYSTSTIASPEPCSSVSISSTCNNGSWSTTPGISASCSVAEVLPPRLSNLVIKRGATLLTSVPAFLPTVLSYTTQDIAFPAQDEKIFVTPTTLSSTATIEVNGIAATSGVPLSLDLPSGSSHTVTVNVTDNGVTETYNVFISKPALPYLSSLLIKRGSTALPLNPMFAPLTLSYNSNTSGPGVSTVSVTPTTMSSAATVQINGMPATSGVASTFPLPLGITTLLISVTDNGDTKTYQVLVSR